MDDEERARGIRPVRGLSASIQRWTFGQLLVFWALVLVAEVGVLLLHGVVSSWGSNATLPPSDPLAGYSRLWRYSDHLTLVGGSVAYALLVGALVTTWIWFGRGSH